MKKILGIGNALVDVLYFLENDLLLDAFSLPKGSMQLVNAETAAMVEKAAGGLNKFMASGGSAANTIHGLARLGIPSAFIGTVGKDDFGRFFKDDMTACGITPLLSPGKADTGRAITLVSQNGERTFATYLGAAVEIPTDKLNTEVFSQFSHLHLEGYLIPNRSLIDTVFALAEQCGLSVSLDLASYNVVEANLEYLQSIIARYKPLVFANEDEARAFSGDTDPIKALQRLSLLTNTAVVKTGASGSLIYHSGNTCKVPALKVNCLDTTGAGDLYAAGFLYGYMNGFLPDKCGNIGSLLAGKVIEEAGAKICEASWQFIGKEMAGY